MSTFSIRGDLGNLTTGGPVELTELKAAVEAVTLEARRLWVSYAEGAPLPDGKVIHARSGGYARSIATRQTGEFSGEVYSELPYADAIENGSPARDLKRMLDSSLKVRLTKDGRRYLIIPFRWQTPGSIGGGNVMTPAVHGWWRRQERSHVTGEYQRPSGTGAYDIHTRQLITVPQKKYFWGARLGEGDAGATKHMAGMVNFRQPGAKGGAAHSQYITFRTMVEGGKGWNAKAVEGKHPARSVADMMRPVAEERFGEAVKRDIARMLGIV